MDRGMGQDRARRARLDVDAALIAAVDHVRLSYHYLDAGDVDGYGSLFEEEAVLVVPGVAAVRGRDELERFERSRSERLRHTVTDVFGSDRRLAAVGTVTGGVRGLHGFVDIFVVSASALLVERHCYFGLPPGSAEASDAHPH